MKWIRAMMALMLLAIAAPGMAADMLKVDGVHSFIIFSVHHFNAGYVYGRFNEPGGMITWDEQDLAKSSIEVSVPSKNIDTANAKRDQDLSGPDFFNTRQYPTLSFKSTSIKKTGDNTYEVAGDMTIKGASKPLTLTLEKTGTGQGMRGETRIGFEGKFTVNRTDFGVSAMPGGIGNDIRLIVALETIQQK